MFENNIIMLDNEKPVLLEVLGDTPVLRVLDFLMTFDCFEYPLSEIAENSNVGWTTLHTFWPKLEEMQIVKLTREVGRAKMYKLNTENPMIRSLMRFNLKLAKYYAEKEIESQIIKA